jgi:phosphohistidine phosphatase
MRLYFLRHAAAVEGAVDATRRLSAQGDNDAHKLAHFLHHARVRFDGAYTSPLVRARQTAEIVVRICGSIRPEQVQNADPLLNEASTEEFLHWLGGLARADHVLLVGHAPSLPERVRQLLAVQNADALKLPTAGLACLETSDRQQMSLRLFISPEVL